MGNAAADATETPKPTPDEPDPPTPKPEWSFRELEDYIRERLQTGERLEAESLKIGKRSAVEVWYAGMALDIIREKRTTKGAWVQWLEAHELNLDTCYQAIRLFQRAESVDDLRDLTLAQARKKYRTDRGKLWQAGTTEGDGKGQPKRAAKPAPKPKYKETEPLKQLRAEFERVVEVVAEVDEDDWKNADPDIYVQQIDAVIERLTLAKRAIRGAQKAARADLKASSKVNAKATVTSSQRRS
ncbi:hypothetical protein HK102_001745 [Quaeritorhiza haematococci]|nr:hypothetical protein HK102_001745 [Quaeritorhiza haematococci]